MGCFMKKIIICFICLSLILCVCGCNSQDDTAVVNVTSGEGIIVNYNYDEDKFYIKDTENYELGYFVIQLGEVSIDNDGIIRMQNNKDYILTLYPVAGISGENFKFSYNNEYVDLTTYDSVYHTYNYNFTSGTTHNIKVEGISRNDIRKMQVSVPVSTSDYKVFYNDTEITDENNDIEVDYNNNLVLNVQVLIDSVPSWTLAYQKEGQYSFNGADASEFVENDDNSRTFTIKMDYNIVRMEVMGVTPIQ